MEIYHFPRDLAQILFEVGPDDDADELAKAVLALSDLFIGRVPWQGEYGRTPGLRAAYLRYFLPVNLPKIRLPLAEWLRADPGRFAQRTLRCLDLGSGPGSALLGLVDFFRGLLAQARPRAIEAVALDQSFENLKDAETLLRSFAARVTDMTVRFQALRLDLVAERAELFPLAAAEGRFDLVIAQNVLCEIAREPRGADRAAGLVEAAAERLLAPGGAIVVIEPGLRETSRDLHRLRNRWLASGAFHVIAPCLHEAPCPALATERDWCIADMPWQPPAIVAEIDRRTGLRKGSLKFSYLVLTKEPAPPPAATAWRVVSDVLDLKGERRVYLCADGRWIVLGQLKRDAKANGDLLAGVARGDLVEIVGLQPKGSLFRLAPGATVRRLAGAAASDSSRLASAPG